MAVYQMNTNDIGPVFKKGGDELFETIYWLNIQMVLENDPKIFR